MGRRRPNQLRNSYPICIQTNTNAGGFHISIIISRPIDDPNSRPGDHVLWKTDGKNRTAVIQVVHPSQRLAFLKLTDDPASAEEVEMASLLELDPHGTHDVTANDPAPSPDELGVHRGEFVFIHKEDTSNGSTMPRVPKIGELESWVQDVPSLHTMQPGGFTNLIYAEGLRIVSIEGNWRDNQPTFTPTGIPVKPVCWFGYVSDVGSLWFQAHFSGTRSWHLSLLLSSALMGRSRLLSLMERRSWCPFKD
jgi:hypothetical protein